MSVAEVPGIEKVKGGGVGETKRRGGKRPKDSRVCETGRRGDQRTKRRKDEKPERRQREVKPRAN
jgi:hypothetical protein